LWTKQNGAQSDWPDMGLDFCVYRKYNQSMFKKRHAAEKRRMGRPPKPSDVKYSQQVNVRMTMAERERLEVEANKLGISLSAFLMRPWRKEE